MKLQQHRASCNDTQNVDRTVEECANEIRIILIGRTGNGKSATGNSILRKNHFESKFHPQSVTVRCKQGTMYRGDKKVIVVDTPGLFDTKKVSDEIRQEIITCIGISSPGPHAIIYVLSLKHRLTEEEIQTFLEIRTIFGKKLFNHVIFLFTGKDEIESKNVPFKEYLSMMPKFFRKVLKNCHCRSIAFNNMSDIPEEDKAQQVDDLFSIVINITKEAKGKYFTNQMILDTEKVIAEELKRLYNIANATASRNDDYALRAQLRENIREQILRGDNILKKLVFLFVHKPCSIL